MTDAPKIDTQAPERIGLIQSPFGFALAYRDEADAAIHYIRADLADARAAAAWIAGRDAALEECDSMGMCNCKAWIEEFATPPADASAALDRLIAERVRGAVREIKEAWDWWQADSYDRCASVVSDAIDEAMNAARGSKEGQS